MDKFTRDELQAMLICLRVVHHLLGSADRVAFYNLLGDQSQDAIDQLDHLTYNPFVLDQELTNVLDARQE